jgi:hypothetical protein
MRAEQKMNGGGRATAATIFRPDEIGENVIFRKATQTKKFCAT